jgi:hypothetical protein
MSNVVNSHATILHPRHINKEESTTEIFSADHPTIGYESLREQRRLQGWSRNWNLRGKKKLWTKMNMNRT